MSNLKQNEKTSKSQNNDYSFIGIGDKIHAVLHPNHETIQGKTEITGIITDITIKLQGGSLHPCIDIKELTSDRTNGSVWSEYISSIEVLETKAEGIGKSNLIEKSKINDATTRVNRLLKLDNVVLNDVESILAETDNQNSLNEQLYQMLNEENVRSLVLYASEMRISINYSYRHEKTNRVRKAAEDIFLDNIHISKDVIHPTIVFHHKTCNLFLPKSDEI